MEQIVTYLSAVQIAERVKAIGAEIKRELRGQAARLCHRAEGHVLPIFAADLVRAIYLPSTRVDFLAVRSYGEGTESTGVVQIVNDLSKPIEEEDVILVEDIVDTGLTINYLLDLLQTRKPKSLKVCSLLHKPARSKVAVPIDYLGFTIEDRFVIGYGLDFAEKYRGLPYIGVIQRAQ